MYNSNKDHKLERIGNKLFKEERATRSKLERMERIGKTLFPESEGEKKFTFNQIQAMQFLTRTGDMQKFNTYTSSCKMTFLQIEQCLNEVTIGEINLEGRV